MAEFVAVSRSNFDATIGTDDLTTTAQTVIGAVNELDGDLAGVGKIITKSDASFSITANTLYKTCNTHFDVGTYVIQCSAEIVGIGTGSAKLGLATSTYTTFPGVKGQYISVKDTGASFTVVKRFNHAEDMCLFVTSTNSGAVYPLITATKISN